MPPERVPLYVRLPREQADELDRLVHSTGRRKQQLVSDLLADRLEMGRLEIREDREPADAVLTLDEVAELLRLPSASVRDAAVDGELPGRRIGGEWRFSRSTVIRWLAGVQEGATPGAVE
ncbi:MAG: helix-turn-helix domain-containing protein [Solirubrobacteraceae bacterium]